MSELARLTEWLTMHALPLWSKSGVDRNRGGFHEKLTHDGVFVDEPRRTRLVARQIYVFATAGEFGWLDMTTTEGLVNHGLDFLLTKCFNDSGTVYSAVSADGKPVRPDFDLYDHAFALFALATAARLGHRRATVVDVARRLLDAMKADWKHPIAGFQDEVLPHRHLRSNPHMHLLEALLEWEAIDDSADWRGLSDEIAHLTVTRLLDPRTGGVPEHFNHDWTRADGVIGRFIEPGHQFEWAWLLWRWGVARGRVTDVASQIHRLTDLAETHGINDRTRLAINGIWDDLSPRECNSRLWPQTERLKGNIAVANSSAGPDRALPIERVTEAAAGIRRYFDTGIAGLWQETLDAHARPVTAPVRASSLYHIVCAVSALHCFVHQIDD